MGLPHEEGWSIPADYPFYPPLPAHYRNVRYQFVFFQAEPAAVAAFLPEPLQAADDAQCMACGMTVPFCSNYGPFDEAFLQLKCTLENQTGWYCSHVFHNGPAGIAAGREIYGTPKIFSDLSIEQHERVMVTTARLGGLSVMTVASTMERQSDADRIPLLAPSWRLKIIPRADRPEPGIKQLIDGATAAYDRQVHCVFQGTGTVDFAPNPLCDLSSLQPRKYTDAFYLESNHSEGFAEIVYDYLAPNH